MLKPCRECAAEISSTAPFCPRCGFPGETVAGVAVRSLPDARRGGARFVIGAIMIVLLGLFVGYGMFLGRVSWDHIWYAMLAILLTLIWMGQS